MRPRIDLRFRPSLIICVGKSGEQIGLHLKAIARFAGLDPVLCQSIAMLQVPEGSDTAVPIPLGDSFADERTPQQEDTLENLVEMALKNVQAHRRIQEIITAGYPVPNPRTQIYIVGDPSVAWLAKVLQIVERKLEKIGFSTLVSYVLSAYQMRQKTGPLDASSPLLEQSYPPASSSTPLTGRVVANFCYLYEDMLAHPVPTFVSEPESHYAAAEALFALIVTGLTTEPFFEEMMRLSTTFSNYDNVGSLSTSLIVFPRATVLDYCSARLGVTLMSQWLRDLHELLIPESKQRELQEQAQRTAQNIEGWIKDRRERPLANGPKQHDEKNISRWPELDILKRESQMLKEIVPSSEQTATEQKVLRNEQIRLHRRLHEETEALFELFWTDDIKNEYERKRRLFDTWTELVYQQAGKAVDAYKDWDKVTTQAWNLAANRISQEIKYTVDQLWSSDETGFELATIYVDELDDSLGKLAMRQGWWRAEHERSYKEALQTFEKLSNGEWVVPEDESNIIGTQAGGGPAQATPTMKGQGIGVNTNTGVNTPPGGGAIIGAAAPNTAVYQHLPPDEERIAQRLEQRILWLQSRIPPLPTQITVATPFILALVLSILAVPIIPKTPLWIAAVTAFVSLLVGGAHWFFRQIHLEKVEAAKEDLLAFYRRYYAYLCEQREDRLRTVLMGPLRRKVQSMRERLDNISDFIREMQHQLDQRATNAQQELFNSPAGVRDIFVANGERLQKEKKNTLEDFAGQMARLRAKEPIEEWHQTSQDLKRNLIAMFRRQPESLMEMSNDKALHQIYEFVYNITSAYCKGPAVDVQYALDKDEIWREALEHAGNPLYRAQVGIKEPQFVFICGRGPDINKGASYIPDAAHPVYISSVHEWILVAAFFKGGSPAILNQDVLFPFTTPADNQSVTIPDDQDDFLDGLDSFADMDEMP